MYLLLKTKQKTVKQQKRKILTKAFKKKRAFKEYQKKYNAKIRGQILNNTLKEIDKENVIKT